MLECTEKNIVNFRQSSADTARTEGTHRRTYVHAALPSPYNV